MMPMAFLIVYGESDDINEEVVEVTVESTTTDARLPSITITYCSCIYAHSPTEINVIFNECGLEK